MSIVRVIILVFIEYGESVSKPVQVVVTDSEHCKSYHSCVNEDGKSTSKPMQVVITDREHCNKNYNSLVFIDSEYC